MRFHQLANALQHLVIKIFVRSVAVYNPTEDGYTPVNTKQLGHKLLKLRLLIFAASEGDIGPRFSFVSFVFSPNAGRCGVKTDGGRIQLKLLDGLDA
jgi:hypothetical protein